jgi:Mg2+ and Co2+ transporters|nr:Loki-CTERM sorting domain-containing protein [Methanoculleus marisnigri]
MQADRGHPEEQEEKRATLRTVAVITGFYGMNLMNIPLEDSPWGYPFVLLLMVGVAVAMLLYFRKKEWMSTTPG